MIVFYKSQSAHQPKTLKYHHPLFSYEGDTSYIQRHWTPSRGVLSFFPPVVLPVSLTLTPLTPNPVHNPVHISVHPLNQNLYILTTPTLIHRRDQYSKTKRNHTRGRNLNRRIGWSIRTSLYKSIRLTTEGDDASKPTA